MLIKDILKNYKNSYKFFVPFDFLYEDKIIVNKNNSFTTVFKVQFNDLDYLEEEDYETILNRLNLAIKRLPNGYTIHFEVQRNKNKIYPKKDLKNKPYPVQIIERLRENALRNEEFYITEYFISITYVLEEKTEDKFNKFFKVFQNPKIKKKNEIEIIKEEVIKELKRELIEFKNTIDLFISQYETGALQIEQLINEELLGFLYTTINNEKKERIKVPPHGSIMLDELLTVSTLKKEDEDSCCKINDEYIKAITINLFPDRTIPRIFDQLEKLDFEYRMVSRFIILTREEALNIMKNYRIYFNMKLKTLAQWIIEAVNQKEMVNVDTNQLEKIDESHATENHLKSGDISFGYYTFTFILKNKNLEELDKNIQEVKKILNLLDIVAGEDKYNTFDSIFGSIPGNIVHNIRKLPMSSKNVATLMPMSSLYTGERYNKHLKDVPLITTKANTELFHFNLHDKDVGHTSIIGPTGYGKSFLLNFILAEFKKYEKAQIFFFDKGASSRVLTELNGGKFYDLGKNELAFQPLANIDEEDEKEWALGWISALLEQEGIKVDAKVRTLIWEALKSLASPDIKKESRTLSNFKAYIQSTTIREALSIYCGNEAYGKYFDNDSENIEENSFITFEMGEVINNEKVIEPLLSYLFHVIEKRLDGKPTIIGVDEFSILIRRKMLAKKIEEWLKTLRKLNTSVVLASQSLVDISDSEIAASIIDACKTQIFLPNEKALSTWKELYQKFDLNEIEINSIREGQKKEDYFVKSGGGARMFQLNPSKTEIVLVGSSDKSDLKKIVEIKEQVDNMLIPENKKILMMNKEWINYKYRTGEIPLYEIEQYKDILV